MARRSAFAAVGTVLVLIAAILFSIAGWLWLAQTGNAIMASFILGIVYLAAGVMFFLAARTPYRRRDLRVAATAGATSQQAKPATALTLLPVAEAFIVGLMAGMRR